MTWLSPSKLLTPVDENLCLRLVLEAQIHGPHYLSYAAPCLTSKFGTAVGNHARPGWSAVILADDEVSSFLA